MAGRIFEEAWSGNITREKGWRFGGFSAQAIMGENTFAMRICQM
jgi:hypothetical protein